MEDFKTEYEKVTLERECVAEKINALSQDEKIKEYFSLCKLNEELANKQKDLYKSMKVSEYSSCNHIWVTILHDSDSAEGRSYKYHGCIKCGLNEMPFYLMEWCRTPDELKLDDRIMYDLLKNQLSLKGTNTYLFCDLKLAKAIYSKIKEAHPDISDETAVKYLRVALYFMRNVKVTDERKVNRAKRLSLNPNYFINGKF